MKTLNLLFITLFLAFSSGVFAQSVGINDDGSAPDANNMLEVKQTKSSGTVYGIYGSATGGATTNYGGYFSATGATNNYGLVVPNGNVGIGTTSPSRKLHIEGLSADNPGMKIHNTSTNGGNFYLYSRASNGSDAVFCIFDEDGSADRLAIDVSGNVGIGTTSPSYKLHVNGSVAGVGTYNALSDGRLKKDVEPIASGLSKIMKLRPVTFNWKTSEYPELKFDNSIHIGFIAQEVEEIVPQAVSTADDEMKTKSISYSDLVPVITKAIQEQQKEIETLKVQNASLTQKIEALEQLRAEVESLKKEMLNINLQASVKQ